MKHNFCRFLLASLCLAGVFQAPQADGLPGEYQITSRWRELFGLHSPVNNPAVVTQEDYWTARLVWAPVLQGAFNLWEVGVTAPIGMFQTVGVSVVGEDDGFVDSTTIDSAGRIMSTGEQVRNTNNLFMLTYAVNPWRKLSVGANLNLAYQSSFGTPVMGLGLDVGLAYILLDEDTWGKHVLGLATQNLLAPSMKASVTPSLGNEGEYARNLKASWTGLFLQKQLEGGIDFDLKDFLAAKNEFKSADTTGTSTFTDKKLEWQLATRFGGWFMRLVNIYGQLGFNKRVIDFWGVAAGVNLPSIMGGRDFQFLYQYNQKTDDFEASSHSFYLRFAFGKHRQETFQSMVKFSPNQLYNKAVELYWKGKYWDAFFVFGQLEKMFPQFFKADWVSYYMASCQEKLDMRQAAVRRFVTAKTKYPASTMIPHADLGLMRVYYRDHSLPDVSNQYLELNRSEVPDTMKYEGYYLMGEAFLDNKRYQDAVRVLAQVPPKHPMYPFAQHSAAIASICDDQDSIAVEFLSEATEFDGKTAAQKEIVNRSRVFLGYLFYEQGSLSKAVTLLRMVPKGSDYYAEAQLGIGWTAVKARQWPDCIAAGRELISVTDLMVLKGEAAILQSYGLLGQRNFEAATAVFQGISDTLQKMTPPRQDSLDMRFFRYREDRTMYEIFASSMNEHAYDLAVRAQAASGAGMNVDSVREQNATLNRTLDSLEAVQRETEKNISGFLLYNDRFLRQSFFGRSIETVRNDINYIHAVVQKHNAVTGSKKAAADSKETQENIDDEIQKLQKEAEELDKKSPVAEPPAESMDPGN